MDNLIPGSCGYLGAKGKSSRAQAATGGCYVLNRQDIDNALSLYQHTTFSLPLIDSGEVSRGEKMLYSGTDPESYITEYTLVYDDINTELSLERRQQRESATS